jgi:Zn-dependent peptidase ImmA (M78 family)
MSTWQETARQSARAILIDYGVEAAPIPVERIIKKKGIRLQFSPFDEALSGMAVIKDNIAVIGVNALHHPNRQRFTMAHELGHHVMHREHLIGTVHVDKGFTVFIGGQRTMLRDELSAAGTDMMEVQANAFASELLMPSFLIEKLMDFSSFGLEDVDQLNALAKRFKVSPQAMQFRLTAFN